MQVLASSSSLRTDVNGYNVSAIVERLKQIAPDIIFLTEKDDMAGELGAMIRNHLKVKVIDCSQDPAQFLKFRDDFFRKSITTPEAAVKKNMIELIDDTVYSYLSNYWKDWDTVNSEVTDSLFRAKHKLVESVFYELEQGFWHAQNRIIADMITAGHPTERSIIISGVERRYWLVDRIKSVMPQL
ncbi:MAG: hypothetical protein QXN26_02730 [Thermoplasmataceae archaeon]